MIPRTALILGLAGLIPFIWGALTNLLYAPFALTAEWLGPRFLHPNIEISYGIVILSFMSGVLWGFATQANRVAAPMAYILSVIPALWTFLAVTGHASQQATMLIIGFVGLLGIDFIFWQQKLTPPWWMKLRTGLTIVVVACLTGVLL